MTCHQYYVISEDWNQIQDKNAELTNIICNMK